MNDANLNKPTPSDFDAPNVASKSAGLPETAQAFEGHGKFDNVLHLLKHFDDSDHAKRTLGLLINMSGKMRMLSHRMVMSLSLIHGGQDDDEPLRFLAVAKSALNDFCVIVDLIELGDEEQQIPPLFSLRLDQLLNGEEHNAGRMLQQFIRAAKYGVEEIDNGRSFTRLGLLELADCVTTSLLPTLNLIVETYGQELNDVLSHETMQNQKAISLVNDAASEIDGIGTRVRMIAMNALIESNRPNASGKSFAVIAREIKELSGDVQNAAQKAKDNIKFLTR